MEIKNIAELGKIADLCRKKGLEYIKITQDTVEFRLSERALKTKSKRKIKDTTPDVLETETATEEELLFWSSAGVSGSEEGAN